MKKNQWALVTGGALRLGGEICLAFARHGWSVVCHYRNSHEAAQELIQKLQQFGVTAVAIQSNLDSAQDAKLLFERTIAQIHTSPDCIVNNASLFEPDTASNFEEDQLLQQIQTNTVVPITLGKLLFQHHESTSGKNFSAKSIVQILDQKVFNLNPDYYSYTLSKLALERSVAQQAQALAPHIRVNAVAPGLMYLSGPQTQENFDIASRANLMQQAIDPAQIAQSVLFLAENPCITGVSLCVDNGQHLVSVPRDIMFVVDEHLKNKR
jgi:NAD(P)-dependent dehydrogenase (short-subunit alcohol dehydrogenase family)